MQERLLLCSIYLQEVEDRLNDLVRQANREGENDRSIAAALDFIRQAKEGISHTLQELQELPESVRKISSPPKPPKCVTSE